MHVFPCTVYPQIIGAFVKHTAPLNKRVGIQDNVSNLVCQAERCLSGLFLLFVSPRMCVLDSYATEKFEMAEA
jgi:hypothetical protein